MNILNETIENTIRTDIIDKLLQQDYQQAIENINLVIDSLYANIPEKKRISYGRVYTIKILSENLFHQLNALTAPVLTIATTIFEKGDDYKSICTALGMLSLCALEDYHPVLPIFETAANSDNWDVREMSQLFFRILFKIYTEEIKVFLLKLVQSERPNSRRFVSETLRPVQENRWFYKKPEYPLSILSHLFEESSAYPRTSVGNNLSDLARRLPDLVYKLVQQLVDSGNKHSYWIAYRACRNIVKTDPLKVMDLLKIDEYKYKKRVYKRNEY